MFSIFCLHPPGKIHFEHQSVRQKSQTGDSGQSVDLHSASALFAVIPTARCHSGAGLPQNIRTATNLHRGANVSVHVNTKGGVAVMIMISGKGRHASKKFQFTQSAVSVAYEVEPTQMKLPADSLRIREQWVTVGFGAVG